MEDVRSFERFIMHCCRMNEGKLRSFLKDMLSANGFSIQEDAYTSFRGERYSGVHNMLCIRGNPKVCLVAHTDCCRDHGYGTEEKVRPVIKNIDMGGDVPRRIIQDKDCAVQLGGDDRLGVAINTWIATNTGYDLALLFTTDEEAGCVSSDKITFPELKTFELVVQTDRGNHSDQLVVEIGGTRLCSDGMRDHLLDIAEKIGLPRSPVRGLLTDVMVLRDNGMCSEACNMTVGYHNSIGSNPTEFIDVEEAYETLEYVSNIVKCFDLGCEEFGRQITDAA
jgi:putative aminopeptidase FrvX